MRQSHRSSRTGYRASSSSFLRSRVPPWNFWIASANSGSEDTAPNKVIDEQNLISSGLPYLPNGSALDRTDKRRALAKPVSQDDVAEIGHGFLARGDGKSLRHRAVTKPGELRKNEPHPVTLLFALTQFREHALVDRRLRIDKALQIEGIGHARLIPGWPKRWASRSRKGRWPARILPRATGRSNHSARSISGKACIIPLLGGHTIS